MNSSAKVLATSFHKENYVTLVMFANVAFGIFAKGSNTLITLTKFPFWIRFVFNGCLMLCGLLGVAFAPNFWIALVAIVLGGCSSSFGESLTLGFLNKYNKESVNAWSSGTGMAGLLGAILYIALSCIADGTIINQLGGIQYFDPQSASYAETLKHINRFVYLGTIPVVLIYWFAYFVVLTGPTDPNAKDKEEKPLLRGEKSVQDISVSASNNSNDSVQFIRESSLRRIIRCFKITFWLSLNLCLVYIFEYTARGFAAKARPAEEYYISELHCPELFASLQLCYQAGVFVSRSSVQLIQIKRVEIFTILQFINMILWIFQAWWKFLPVYFLPVFMIYVGVLGGGSYVNIFYLLRTDSKYPTKDRELCINVSSLWITLGILLGTSLPLPLFQTIFKDK